MIFKLKQKTALAYFIYSSIFSLGLVLPCSENIAYADNTTIRIMSANTTSTSSQAYSSPGIHIFQGLDPDIIAIQEFSYNNDSVDDIEEFVDTAFGIDYYYYREPSYYNIPNGIISRYPILQSGSWDDSYVSDRGYAWAQIDIPGDVDLWVVSLHLLSTSSDNRSKEATEIVAKINQTVPEGDYLVIAGDFNTSSRSESCISTFSKEVYTSSPYPIDKNDQNASSGNSNTNEPRNKPYDWVLVNSELLSKQIPLVIADSNSSNTFTNGLVFDSRVYTPLDDVYPVQYNDSNADNNTNYMQHMAVMKAFSIPSDGSSSSFEDLYEPDNTSDKAKTITLNATPQKHNIDPANDSDWLVFTLAATTNTKIETYGPDDGDTYVRLFYKDQNGNMKYLSYDDDSGADNYSKLSSTLQAGTYYIKVTSYNNKSTIMGYTIQLTNF